MIFYIMLTIFFLYVALWACRIVKYFTRYSMIVLRSNRKDVAPVITKDWTDVINDIIANLITASGFASAAGIAGLATGVCAWRSGGDD